MSHVVVEPFRGGSPTMMLKTPDTPLAGVTVTTPVELSQRDRDIGVGRTDAGPVVDRIALDVGGGNREADGRIRAGRLTGLIGLRNGGSLVVSAPTVTVNACCGRLVGDGVGGRDGHRGRAGRSIRGGKPQHAVLNAACR